jgi:hypothetical protein
MRGAEDRSPHRGPAVLGFVLVVVLLSVARSVDVPRAGYGVKSDEATYVAMALSLAFDGNLSYERQDLERFVGLYHMGPEGIFLKSGKRLRLAFRAPFPYVHLVRRSDPDTSRLYFGKAFAYPLFAAPLVRLFGLNGMLVLNVLLLAGAGVCGYLFLAAQSPPTAAATFATAFFGAASVPVYGVFLMPEIFNFSLVFFAYFLWLYKEVRPAPDPASGGGGPGAGALAGRWTDIAAAVLLGVATYSKPAPNIFLVAPLVLFAGWRSRWRHAASIAVVAAATTAALFAATGAVSGEFNYQGGPDRKTVYSRPSGPDFPFETPDATWDRFPGAVATDGAAALGVLTDRNAPHWFVHNLQYFFVGRHFGFIPYYFPGAVAVIAWLLSGARRDAWRILIAGSFVAAAVGLLLILPFTWSGGGGPPGNRYLISAYPVLLFLVPPMGSAIPGVVAWIGGALFTAKMLLTPFETAKFTWLTTERGLFRRLPVELTMYNDLPVMLAQPLRGRVMYGRDPFLLLYFLDQNAWPPEPDGMWVSGAGRADILVRAVAPIDHLAVEAQSPIRTVVTVSLGGAEVRTALEPGRVAAFEVPAGGGVRGRDGYAYLMTAQSSEAFVPQVLAPQTDGPPDYRNLGAQLRFRPVSRVD